MKFILASLILFLGMYALAEQDELEVLLQQSTCEYKDAKGQPIPAKCDGIAQPKKNSSKELDNKVSSVPNDEELDVE